MFYKFNLKSTKVFDLEKDRESQIGLFSIVDPESIYQPCELPPEQEEEKTGKWRKCLCWTVFVLALIIMFVTGAIFFAYSKDLLWSDSEDLYVSCHDDSASVPVTSTKFQFPAGTFYREYSIDTYYEDEKNAHHQQYRMMKYVSYAANATISADLPMYYITDPSFGSDVLNVKFTMITARSIDALPKETALLKKYRVKCVGTPKRSHSRFPF